MSVNQYLNGKLNLIAGAGGGSVIADDNTFTGTTAEVEAAIADGLIEDDTIVFITDDVEEGENEEIEIEVLDTYDEIMANAELGKVAGAAGVKEGFEKVNNAVLDTYEEIMNNTEADKIAGAIGVKEGFDKIKSEIPQQDNVLIWSGTLATWDKANYLTIDLDETIYDKLNATTTGKQYYTDIHIHLGGGDSAPGGTGGNIVCDVPLYSSMNQWNIGGPLIQGKCVFMNLDTTEKKFRIWCDSNPSFSLRSIRLLKR